MDYKKRIILKIQNLYLDQHQKNSFLTQRQSAGVASKNDLENIIYLTGVLQGIHLSKMAVEKEEENESKI